MPTQRSDALVRRPAATAGAKTTTQPLPRRKIQAPPKPTDDEADEVDSAPPASYFTSGNEKENLQFISSGCGLMDCALGGGWALGRVVNIVGDRSSGKTLLAMEACANFAAAYPNGWIRYAESEAAFDVNYAAALGVPVERIQFNSKASAMGTVEDWEADMVAALEAGKGRPGLYILDSLDALSDEAELKRDFGEGTYGGTKPKLVGQLFRQHVDALELGNVCLIVVSQLREKLGVTFGETKTRSGGKALDFYASHIVWLAEKKKLTKTIDGVERVIGIDVLARVKKNKVGLPFREAAYPILFGYGIDDLIAGAEWLLEVDCKAGLEELQISKAGYKTRIANIRNKGGDQAREFRETLKRVVATEWNRIEVQFLPKARKY